MSSLRIQARERRIVGIGELLVSADPQDVLVTFSLGSCVGVSLFDPVRGVGGLIHCMLPLATHDPERARRAPAIFVDSGLNRLLDEVFALGARRDELVVKLAGGGSHAPGSDAFRIGERNCAVVRKVLWKNDLLLAAHDTGGSEARTMTLYLADGRTTVRSRGEERELGELR
jgi:chemotaxis protein CheD